MAPEGTSGASRIRGLERHWWTLIAVCLATFMLLVDVTIVQVALPTIQRKLHASFSDLQWLISAYALSLSALILTSGAIADRLGRKRVFLFGLGVFSAASLICGLSTSAGMLVAARAVQGIGGAAMFATGLALIGQDFQGPFASKRTTAIAIWGATVGGAVAIGPLVGGVLTAGLGWQWIFYVNVPIGVATFALALNRMVNKADPGATRLDLWGLVTFSGSLFLLVFALVIGNDDGWSSTKVLAMLIGAGLLMAAFIVVELTQKRPMFDLSLFRKPSFTGVSFATLMVGAGMFAMFPYITLYLQNDLGYSPLQGGLRMLPATLLTFVVPIASRRLAERIPPGVALGVGLAITAAGIAVMARVTVGSTWTVLLPGLLLIGLGIGLANPTNHAHRSGRRATSTNGHGVGDQQHLPDRRPFDRRRRTRSHFPAATELGDSVAPREGCSRACPRRGIGRDPGGQDVQPRVARHRLRDTAHVRHRHECAVRGRSLCCVRGSRSGVRNGQIEGFRRPRVGRRRTETRRWENHCRSCGRNSRLMGFDSLG